MDLSMFQLNSKMHPTKTIGGHQLSHKEDLVDEVSLKNHLDPSPSIKSLRPSMSMATDDTVLLQISISSKPLF